MIKITPPRRSPVRWPAIAISLGAHGLLVLGLYFLTSTRGHTASAVHRVCNTRVATSISGSQLTLDVSESKTERLIPIIIADAQPVTGPVQAPVVLGHSAAAPEKTISPPSPLISQVARGTGRAMPHGSGSDGESTSAGQGRPSTTFFHVSATGKSFVYVIDRSASMGLNGALTAAKRELQASLEQLPPQALFQIVAYNRTAEPMRIGNQVGLVLATAENKQIAEDKISALEPEGGTEHLPALRRALSLSPDVIYFLTDANEMIESQVRAITTLNHGRTAIHALTVSTAGMGAEGHPLQSLAGMNRGDYRRLSLINNHWLAN